MTPFSMTIEMEPGDITKHRFHIGNSEKIARHFVEEKFRARSLRHLPTVSISLTRDGKVVDVFYGNRWRDCKHLVLW